MILLGSHKTAHVNITHSCSIYYTFHKKRFLTFLCFSILEAAIRLPDAKRAQRLGDVSLIKLKHELKPVTIIKRLNMYFTIFTPDFLWAKKTSEQNFV